MAIFQKIYESEYVDSLETLFRTMILSEQQDVTSAYVCMGTDNNKTVIADMGLMTDEIRAAGEGDLIVVASAASPEAFSQAIASMEHEAEARAPKGRASTPTIEAAVAQRPDANVCVLSIPGEHVKEAAMQALDAGMHLLIFSSHVAPQDERDIKLYAKEKGLLCMGPDCGVVNLNGAAFVLGSITRRGPVGICGASGIGVQYVGAMLHAAGSGVSQIIGTGGGDTKDAVGGLTMLAGIDALENDADTQFIVLVSRKPGEETLRRILGRVANCRKPVVVYLMGVSREEVEAHGGLWAANLEDAAKKALALVGKQLPFDDESEFPALAKRLCQGMDARQKYVRGAFLGGTYCDEAIRTLTQQVGDVFSNAPISPETQLADVSVSVRNTVIDYGEEEFTQGRPHPTIEPSVRLPAILHEAEDPETAVLLLDFVLTPAGPKDPVGPVIREIEKAKALVKARGGELAVVASVCGTDADVQNRTRQEEALRQAGVHVCLSNYKAALLAGEIVMQRGGGTK